MGALYRARNLINYVHLRSTGPSSSSLSLITSLVCLRCLVIIGAIINLARQCTMQAHADYIVSGPRTDPPPQALALIKNV